MITLGCMLCNLDSEDKNCNIPNFSVFGVFSLNFLSQYDFIYILLIFTKFHNFSSALTMFNN